MKIGVYGGTFNPPHLGHLTAARAVFDLLKLDKLLLVPAGSISQELKTTALAVSLATLAMGNVAFLLYDRALHNLLQVYQLVWRPKLHKMLGK